VSDCLANKGARSDCLECEWGGGGFAKEWKRTLYGTAWADGGQRKKVKNGMLVLESSWRERREEERREDFVVGGAMAWPAAKQRKTGEGLGLPLLQEQATLKPITMCQPLGFAAPPGGENRSDPQCTCFCDTHAGPRLLKFLSLSFQH
jgi:hypothetical protein